MLICRSLEIRRLELASQHHNREWTYSSRKNERVYRLFGAVYGRSNQYGITDGRCISRNHRLHDDFHHPQPENASGARVRRHLRQHRAGVVHHSQWHQPANSRTMSSSVRPLLWNSASASWNDIGSHGVNTTPSSLRRTTMKPSLTIRDSISGGTRNSVPPCDDRVLT